MRCPADVCQRATNVKGQVWLGINVTCRRVAACRAYRSRGVSPSSCSLSGQELVATAESLQYRWVVVVLVRNCHGGLDVRLVLHHLHRGWRLAASVARAFCAIRLVAEQVSTLTRVDFFAIVP
jgi:hypothetical protein